MSDAEEFLAHHGVKGQRWGVIRARLAKNRARSKQFKKDDKRKHKERLARVKAGTATKKDLKLIRTHRIYKGVGVANKVIAAALITTHVLHYSQTRVTDLPDHLVREGKATAEQVIRNTQKTQMSSLKRMFAEGKMDEEQFKNFSKILNDRFDRKVADAIKNNLK